MSQSAAPQKLPPPGPPSAHVVPFRMRPDDTQVIEGRLVGPGCPVCRRSDVQHGALSCRQLDLIAERVAYGRLPWWRRLLRRAPEGWRR